MALYNIMVVGQERKPWRMSNDYKRIMIRMTKPGQIDRCRSDAGVCVAMLQVNHERTSRKHFTTRMDDKGSWVCVVELLKLLAAELEAAIAEGKETAVFFKEDPEDTYSCYTVRPLIRIPREEFFAEDVDPQSGALRCEADDRAAWLACAEVIFQPDFESGVKHRLRRRCGRMGKRDESGKTYPRL